MGILVAMELVLLMGIPGSGKSTYYQRYAETHLRLNLDQLNGNRVREQLLFYAGLAGKTKMVIDNVNGTKQARQHYIRPAKAAGYTVLGIHIFTDIALAIERNNQRTGKARLPERGVTGHLGRWEDPDLDEGFDEVVLLDQDFGVMSVLDLIKAVK